MSWFAEGLFWNALANPSSKMFEPMEPCFPIYLGEEAKHLSQKQKNIQQVWEKILSCKFEGPLLSKEIVHTSQQIMIDFDAYYLICYWGVSLAVSRLPHLQSQYFGTTKNAISKDDTRNMLDVCYVEVNSPPVTLGQKVSPDSFVDGSFHRLVLPVVAS